MYAVYIAFHLTLFGMVWHTPGFLTAANWKEHSNKVWCMLMKWGKPCQVLGFGVAWACFRKTWEMTKGLHQNLRQSQLLSQFEAGVQWRSGWVFFFLTTCSFAMSRTIRFHKNEINQKSEEVLQDTYEADMWLMKCWSYGKQLQNQVQLWNGLEEWKVTASTQ